MEPGSNERQRALAHATDVAIRLGALALLIGWCALIVAPFLLAIAWGCIIAIALYGPFLVLSQWLGGRRTLAATLLVLAGMLVMAWNLVRTYRAAPAIAPQPLLPVDPSQVRA